MSKLVYLFDDWRLDTGRRTLTNPQGEFVRLTPTEFDVLTILCQRPQEAVPRLALLQDRHVTDKAADVCMCRIKKKMGADAPTLIKTIRHKGFFLTAPVTAE